MRKENFTWRHYLLFSAAVTAIFVLCVCAGSADVPLRQTAGAVWSALTGRAAAGGAYAIITQVRLPRVLCVALVGSSLALCGTAMQGLLRNPLADGSTLGVSSGAALGAAAAIAFGFSIPGLPGGGVMAPAMASAFLSMALVLTLAWRLDRSLSAHSIILIGVVFSMFSGSLVSLVVAFAGEQVRSVVFWTMGSLSGTTYGDALTLALALLLCGLLILRCSRELDAFALGEDNALSIGVNVRRVKLVVMAACSALIGVCVSVGGSIGFVGLIIPHIARMIIGPAHRRLMPACIFCGAAFLMLADLAARTVLSPRALPLGVVTSLTGTVVFIWIFYQKRGVRGHG